MGFFICTLLAITSLEQFIIFCFPFLMRPVVESQPVLRHRPLVRHQFAILLVQLDDAPDQAFQFSLCLLMFHLMDMSHELLKRFSYYFLRFHVVINDQLIL